MTDAFEHPAKSLTKPLELIYAAMSKHTFYLRQHISRYILSKQAVPLNPFMLFDYFLLDTLPRDLVRQANNSLVQRADQLWVFGPISNGVLVEIELSYQRGLPIRYFLIDEAFSEVSAHEMPLEEEIAHLRERLLALSL